MFLPDIHILLSKSELKIYKCNNKIMVFMFLQSVRPTETGGGEGIFPGAQT